MKRDLKSAIRDMLVVLADKSRIAALDGKREDGNKTEMTHAIYTACGLCEKDPARPPLWQLKSIKVVHDKKRRTIEYKDAWLEIAGVPVAYTPYLTHPDPTVKQRSGFLPASVGSSSVWEQSFASHISGRFRSIRHNHHTHAPAMKARDSRGDWSSDEKRAICPRWIRRHARRQ